LKSEHESRIAGKIPVGCHFIFRAGPSGPSRRNPKHTDQTPFCFSRAGVFMGSGSLEATPPAPEIREICWALSQQTLLDEPVRLSVRPFLFSHSFYRASSNVVRVVIFVVSQRESSSSTPQPEGVSPPSFFFARWGVPTRIAWLRGVTPEAARNRGIGAEPIAGLLRWKRRQPRGNSGSGGSSPFFWFREPIERGHNCSRCLSVPGTDGDCLSSTIQR